MNVFALNALILVLCFFLVVIKQIKPEYALAASSVVAISLACVALASLDPLLELVRDMDVIKDNAEYFKAVVKSLGVALLCSVAVEICKDFGENAFAFGIELLCKCEIIVMSVPLVTEIIRMAKDMLSSEI